MGKLTKLRRNVYVSWKTSLFGVIALLPNIFEQIALLFDNDAMTNPDYNLLIPAISGLIALLSAKDGDVSTEEVKGIKK